MDAPIEARIVDLVTRISGSDPIYDVRMVRFEDKDLHLKDVSRLPGSSMGTEVVEKVRKLGVIPEKNLWSISLVAILQTVVG